MRKLKITHYFLIPFASLLLISACSLDVEPTDLSTINALLSQEGGIETATNGNYALLKDVLPFRGQEFGNDNNDYTRHLYQMTEFASDNVMYTQFSSDPLYLVFTREHFPDQENSSYMWFISYRMILGTNLIIDNKEEGESQEIDQILGENYFLRAMASFDLLRFFAPSYNQGTSNLGIVLRTSIDDPGILPRSTVGESYDQVVNDLLKAEALMSDSQSRGVQFASKVAAQALLSRVYLYMEDYDKCIEYSNKVINNNAGISLASSSSYLDNFANTELSSESIFVVSFTIDDHRGKNGSIGSMYYDDGNNSGWGEVFASKKYLDLIRENPEDIRNDLVLSTGGTKNGFPIHYILKFSGQDGIVNLASPQLLRLSEIYLNRAEALAQSGNESDALADVNLIRQRAGYSNDKLYQTGSLNGASVLDLVLKERQLELAFEGHRAFDLRRNQLSLDRDFIGVHNDNGDTRLSIPWDDNRNIFFVPGIELITNPELEQNN